MVTLDLADTVEAPARCRRAATATRSAVVDGVSGSARRRAARARTWSPGPWAWSAGRPRGAVAKHIPAGAGLGGGSADAAAVLRWAGCDDLERAGLGADVPFCVIGGRARVRGIGEIVEPLPFEPRTFTLLTPPFGCSTPAVYRRWDELGGPRRRRPQRPRRRPPWPSSPAWPSGATAWPTPPDRAPRLAGSGSTWFVEGAFPGPDRVVARTIPPARHPASPAATEISVAWARTRDGHGHVRRTTGVRRRRR